MTTDVMNKAVELHTKIEQVKALLSSFSWEPIAEFDYPPVSRHPVLVIRSDDGENGKDDFTMPFELNPDMIRLVYDYAMGVLVKLQNEFNDLKTDTNGTTEKEAAQS